ncbi:death-on-curing protein [Neisseria arctica]|uniref:Death-on-curing protein n=1 Tax=Neisseria arctica TaxID=1470200 RepID=A0A0J0YUF2_9NEIS|nr:Fic family protein [Neisseria arctica]KLT73729.1 death-on-curing protein [Neisseria arctica]UOO85867.1 Fic family protein [Neisseria arctica]
MTIKVVYFDVPHALQVYDWIIAQSGGLSGIHVGGEDKLDSVLEHIQNDVYYPTFEEKLTHLLYSINKLHAFLDGNKRASLVLAAYFLELNGYDYCVKRFVLEMENIVVWLAESKISKELLEKLVKSIIDNEDEFSEAVKYELICAISE